jgi:cell division septation protein DedD
MATTTHDEGFHEIQLNGKQLVFLFMAGTVVAVVIFLLGVFVGRGVRTQGPGAEPLIAEQGAAPAAEAPPALPSSSGGVPATAKEPLDYSERLTGTPPQETLRAGDAKPTPPPAAEEPKARADASTPAKPAAPEVRPTPPAAASAAAAPGEPAGDGFAIQLAALGKRDEAETIVRRLTSKGYSAYVMAPAAGAVQMYRVRVGKFKDRREAEAVSARLKKEEQFNPWIVR